MDAERDVRMMQKVTSALTRHRRAATRGAKTLLSRALPRIAGSPWVFGGSSGRSYADNSREVHQLVLRLRPDRMPTWVIDGDSPDRASVAEYGDVAERGSLHAHRLAASAEVIVFSHGIHDVPGMMASKRAVRVRLGHGLTAFKSATGRTSLSARRMVAAVDLAPVASPLEQSHKMSWGFPEHKLPITGLPRWDRLVREHGLAQSRPKRRPLILYAPTWRSWHSKLDSLRGGRLMPVVDFIESSMLQTLLRDNDADLTVYLHPNLRHTLSHLQPLPPRFSFVDNDRDVQTAVANASLVISDYSSILWDALYVDCPVIFFMFDREEHENRVGSFIDLSGELFGASVVDTDGLLTEIARVGANSFHDIEWREARKVWQRQAFAYRDNRNAERVLAAIEARILK